MVAKNYIKSLDGLRFLAVSLVLIGHWSSETIKVPIANLGVCMFFVLSGFLISRILMRAKEKDENLGRGHGFSMKQFYIRRTIRIFPLYYLSLLVLFIWNVPPVREKIGWLVTYTSNIYMAWNGTWMGSVDHLWSLAVEEQFYLFFPFIVLFVPLRYLQKVFIGFAFLSVIFRAILYFSGSGWIAPYILMPTCLDAFGLGALLAYISLYQPDFLVRYLAKWQVMVFGLVFYFVIYFVMAAVSEGHNWVYMIWLRLGESVLSFCLLAFIINENSNHWLKRIFEINALVYIGKISYGIYVIHNFVYNEYHPIKGSPIVSMVDSWNRSESPLISSISFRIIILYLIVIVLASLSWYLFEKPINKLKDRYGY